MTTITGLILSEGKYYNQLITGATLRDIRRKANGLLSIAGPRGLFIKTDTGAVITVSLYDGADYIYNKRGALIYHNERGQANPVFLAFTLICCLIAFIALCSVWGNNPASWGDNINQLLNPFELAFNWVLTRLSMVAGILQ